MKNKSFRAGLAQVDVTPKLGTVINGEFSCRYANKIADPLYAKALVLQDNHLSILIVIVDICAMQREFLDKIKARIHKEIGIPPGQQMIASTHTHSAGSVADLLLCHVDWGYLNWLPDQIVLAAKQAYENVKEARIGWGDVDQPQHLLCRRYLMQSGYRAMNPVTGALDDLKTNPFGDEHLILGPSSVPDSGLRYLAIQGTDGEWMGLLANYSLHYVGDCERGTISADYFGYFARSVACRLGAKEGFVGMMSNGTSGEVNIWSFQNEDTYPKEYHEKSRLIGEDLAGAVINSLDEMEWEESPSLSAAYEELQIAYRKPTTDEVEKAMAIVSGTDYEQIAFGDIDFYQQVYAREQILLDAYPEKASIPVQSFVVGSGKIGGLGGEFFAETGLRIKEAQSNNHYFTICFANDYVGYVPPVHELEKGGYETWRCRTSCLEPAAEEKIRLSLQNQMIKHG